MAHLSPGPKLFPWTAILGSALVMEEASEGIFTFLGRGNSSDEAGKSYGKEENWTLPGKERRGAGMGIASFDFIPAMELPINHK